ncbi:MAG: hypothetical protein COR54_13385 [Elusimicrobia bacterium CG22_combo_CG10-13_8_21_14_all_63_91]|nr:MAG: hypothetical protein COR54_13385 [Elusimicrobia bacterium CG22_combo_CG10-13_8_21_14_all_63_91]
MIRLLVLTTLLAPLGARAEITGASPARTLEEQKAAEFTVRLDRSAETPEIAESVSIDAGEFLPEGAKLPPNIRFEGPVLEYPVLAPASAGTGRGLGGFVLKDRLDSHADLYTKTFGTREWNLSVAGDPGFQTAYLRLERPDEKQLHKIKDLNELRGNGVNIKIDDRTVYNFKVAINIFSPTRKSTLKITPIQGTQGPAHAIKTGAILDRVREKSFVFKAGGNEFWTLYGTDVDPQTNWFADTRSFLILHENGLSSKMYPIAEAKLAVGLPVEVALGAVKIVMLRTEDGRVEFFEPGVKDGRVARK